MPAERIGAEAVKKNVARMLIDGASAEEVDIYVASQGHSPESLKEDKYTLDRSAWQTVGGVLGGVVASPGGVTTPVGIGLGSAIFGQAHDLIKEKEGRKVPETVVERSKSAVEDFSLDVILPVGISKAGTAVKRGVVATGRGIKKVTGKVKDTSAYERFRKFGVSPSVATASQSRVAGVAEHALSDFPTSGDIVQRHAKKNIEQLTAANKFLAREYGPFLSREEIGTLLKKATPNVLEKYSEIYERLFSRVAEEIGAQPQSVKNTIGMFKTILGESKQGPSTGVIGMAKEIAAKAKANGGGLSWKALKDHRTKVGELMKDPALISTRNIQSRHLKRIYGALTMDMEEAAVKAGENVHAKWRAANKYFEIKTTRDIPILEDIVKKKYPEEVFDIAMRSSRKGGTRLRLLRKQLTDREWDAVAGTVLGEMGKQVPSAGTGVEAVFSPATFMTNWNKLSATAKKALFGGSRYRHLAKELDEFVRVAGDFKAIEQLANKSRTGSVLMFYGIYQSSMAAVGGIAGGSVGGVEGAVVGGASFVAMGLAGPRYTAKLLTNPKFVRWLNQGFKIAKTKPNAMSTHLGRLMYLRFNPSIQEDVDNIIRGMIGK
jgi:Tfp pilus assembly protein PilP